MDGIVFRVMDFEMSSSVVVDYSAFELVQQFHSKERLQSGCAKDKWIMVLFKSKQFYVHCMLDVYFCFTRAHALCVYVCVMVVFVARTMGCTITTMTTFRRRSVLLSGAKMFVRGR